MADTIAGIHHITAIAGDPQTNLDFYTNTLGLRLVKRTVNFDDPQTYHLYFGNETGQPGTILTFFPWGSTAHGGKPGIGQATEISFSVPANSLGYWKDRLEGLGLAVDGPFTRFDLETIHITDPDGIDLALVGVHNDSRPAMTNGPVPAEHSIRGFHSVAMTVDGYERTAGLLQGALGFRPVGEAGERFRFEVGSGGPGSIIDILCHPTAPVGLMGVGAIHHIAWRAADDAAQLRFRTELTKRAFNVTPIIDRNYFHSIYFREPGGVLFEIATDPPGFGVDEPLSEFGTHLMLPDWLEARREEIQLSLQPLRLPNVRETQKA